MSLSSCLRPLKRLAKNALLSLPALGPTGRPRIYVNTNPVLDQGPNVFVRKMTQGLKTKNIGVSHIGMRGCEAALLINNTWGDYFYRRAHRYGTRIVLRVDGFYPPLYFDGRPTAPFHQDRRLTSEKNAFNERLKSDLSLANHVVYQSAWSKMMCDTHLAGRTHDFSIVHNGVDLDLFKPKMRRNGEITILAVGNLRHEYMVETIGSVFLAVRADQQPVHLLIAGTMDTINQRTWERFLREHPREFQTAKYLGPVKNEDLPGIYQQADVYLHSRAGDWCPNVVVEALSCGLPVVCPKWGGTSELIGAGGIAVEAEPWDYSNKFIVSMAAGVKQVMENMDAYKEKARSHALENFSMQKMTDNYITALLPRSYAEN